MAYYRQIYTTFWTDSKVADDFTPEDKYFYLYLLTNAHTNLCGCYEISKKQISNDTGYTIDVVERLLKRLDEVHGIINYSEETKEVYLVNWHKYNWSKSEKVLKGVASEIERIKSKLFQQYLLILLEGYGYPIDTVSIGYAYPMDTSVTVTDTVINTVTDKEPISNNSKKTPKQPEWASEVVDYLNEKTGKHFKASSSANVKFISARAKEGYTAEDFKKVIDTKVTEWKGTDMEQYLRPETLFSASKFEAYLNQKTTRRSAKNDFNNFDQHDYDMSELTKKAKRRVTND